MFSSQLLYHAQRHLLAYTLRGGGGGDSGVVSHGCVPSRCCDPTWVPRGQNATHAGWCEPQRRVAASLARVGVTPTRALYRRLGGRSYAGMLGLTRTPAG